MAQSFHICHSDEQSGRCCASGKGKVFKNRRRPRLHVQPIRSGTPPPLPRRLQAGPLCRTCRVVPTLCRIDASDLLWNWLGKRKAQLRTSGLFTLFQMESCGYSVAVKCTGRFILLGTLVMWSRPRILPSIARSNIAKPLTPRACSSQTRTARTCSRSSLRPWPTCRLFFWGWALALSLQVETWA